MHHPFIETQFPLARLSMESYKERTANLGQTLTGLGKWWGRKPLILVRASILGLLMPASDNTARDREIFYKILTMDEDGLYKRKNKKFTAKDIASLLGADEVAGLVDSQTGRWVRGASDEDKDRLEKLAFARLPYGQKLERCCRQEEIDGPTKAAWSAINAHLGTNAGTMPELFDQLSHKAFGHKARVGDCFCGGGSVPFEAARLGLDAYGSDLSPVAALLTWGAIHLVGGGLEVQARVRAAQEEAWKKADGQITAWGIASLVSLRAAFTDKIIPLLREYFYGDWSKIAMVLGSRFVRKNTAMVKWPKDVEGDNYASVGEIWNITASETGDAEAFRSIYA